MTTLALHHTNQMKIWVERTSTTRFPGKRYYENKGTGQTLFLLLEGRLNLTHKTFSCSKPIEPYAAASNGSQLKADATPC